MIMYVKTPAGDEIPMNNSQVDDLYAQAERLKEEAMKHQSALVAARREAAIEELTRMMNWIRGMDNSRPLSNAATVIENRIRILQALKTGTEVANAGTV